MVNLLVFFPSSLYISILFLFRLIFRLQLECLNSKKHKKNLEIYYNFIVIFRSHDNVKRKKKLSYMILLYFKENKEEYCCVPFYVFILLSCFFYYFVFYKGFFIFWIAFHWNGNAISWKRQINEKNINLI